MESEIISWANRRLEEGGKGVMVKHFQDKTNKTALPILHLIDVMKPGNGQKTKKNKIKKQRPQA